MNEVNNNIIAWIHNFQDKRSKKQVLKDIGWTIEEYDRTFRQNKH